MRSIIIFCFSCMSMFSFAQTQSIKNFIFGHSLIDHRPPAIPTPSDETTVPHWVYLLAKAAGNDYAAGGQYGFLPQHQNTPPFSQWGYDMVPGVWDSDIESFDQADINTILITAGNFIQYQAPTEPYYNDPSTTPISATEKVIDFVGEKKIYIYENWPDMATFIADEGFPPSTQEFKDYHRYTIGEFHDWWISYHDALLTSKPSAKVRMIPVGPILSELTNGLLANIDIEELYEDNAPHGRPNIYFLAGLVTYMSMYEEKAPSDFDFPGLIHSDIVENYSEIVNYIWNYLVNFKDAEGESRVFFNSISSNSEVASSPVRLYPNPAHQVLFIDGFKEGISVRIRGVHSMLSTQMLSNSKGGMDIGYLPSGMYLLEFPAGDGYHAAKFIKL